MQPHFGKRVNTISEMLNFQKPRKNMVGPAWNKMIPRYENDGRGMHHYFRWVLLWASCAGVFPVSGVHHENVFKLSFSWLSPFTVYSVALLTGYATIEIISLDYTIRNLNEDSLTAKGGLKKATSGSIFYGNACIATCLFISLARRWPGLVREWRGVEISMARFGSPKLGWRFAMCTILLMGLAFTEHGLHNWLNTRPGSKDDIAAMSFNSTGESAENDAPHLIDQSLTFKGYLERFALKTHWYLFTSFRDYHPIKGFIVMWLSLSATFLWNFTDLFIMLVSTALAAQFKQLTVALRGIRGKMLSMVEWREYRETYTSLTHLVKTVDENINTIITLSVAGNVYFICAQLITEIDSITHSYFRTLFYLYSFLFLVFRTTAVVMLAAEIHDESSKIVPELFFCPYQSYCLETQRFLQEATSDYVSLTGLNMFSVTRNFLLGIVGAILTYEIVLIQLQQPKEKPVVVMGNF
ncbi:unnamed protein product [Bemisia tabaci]|uniref:Gustatory receptor n=1 Tax=Bemisia tabaci TaxID=7038 RepID=A0A9P0AE29_BEMTA|nr:PREDICTED: gustatory receptor for sugar taste 64f-like [Bemisia tabaci]CAH0389772.1 unnamed protein product [Bemisia tabaci]